MDQIPCGDPLCEYCTAISNMGPMSSCCGGVSNTLSAMNPGLAQQDQCMQCSSIPGAVGFCGLQFIESIGIGVTGTPTSISPTGTVFHLTVGTGGVCFDTARVINSIATINSQVPTGSLQGYLSSIYSNVRSKLSTSITSTLTISIGAIVMLSWVLYSITCILLMAYSHVGIAVGITLIIIGLIFALLAYIIVLLEISALSNVIDTELFTEFDSVVSTVGCALTAGLCCYSGGACCCPGISNSPCTNPPFSPGVSPCAVPMKVVTH